MATLVTGSTGLLGNNLVRLLLERGESVRALQRVDSDPRPLAGLDVEVAPGDVRDRAAVARACQGVSCVLHAAARVHIGWTGLDLQRSINVEGTRNVADAALDVGARFVHVSSVDTLGWGSIEAPGTEDSPALRSVPCPYVVTKREAEHVVLGLVARGLDGVIVNPAYMLGPWDWKPSSGRLLLEVARGRGLFAPPGGNDFCDVRDVADGILSAARLGVAGRRYILGGESLSYFNAWRMFAAVSGARPPRRVVRPWLVRAAGWAGSVWTRVSGAEPDLNSAAAQLAIMPHHFSSLRAQVELGYSPRPAVEAAQAAWAWFLERGYATPSRRRKPVAAA